MRLNAGWYCGLEDDNAAAIAVVRAYAMNSRVVCTRIVLLCICQVGTVAMK